MYRITSLLVCLLCAGITATAQPTVPDTTQGGEKSFPISGTIKLSALLKTGNVDASNLDGALLLKTATGPLQHAAMFDYKRTSQQQAGSKVEYTVQFVEYQMSFPIIGSVQGLLGGEIESNEIRQIDYRYMGYAGSRVKLVQSQQVQLVYTAAGGYADQKFGSALAGLHQNFPIFYTGANFIWHLTETSQFSKGVNYFTEFASQTEHRLIGNAEVKSQLSKILAITLKFEYDYSSRTFDYLQVSQQNEPWNLTFSAGLQAQF